MIPLREELAERGYAVQRSDAVDAARLADPWSLVESLVGERPRMLERQWIKPVSGGRSFASTAIFTPLHTDSQPYAGGAPALQVMWCARPAAEGGDCLLVDGALLLSRIEQTDAALYRRLFDVERTIPFYFGAIVGPTVRRGAGGARVLTVSPMKPDEARDPVGAAFAAYVEAAPRITVRLGAGDLLLVDNHRMLHGRTAFRDERRELLRFLAWLDTPLAHRAPVSAPLAAEERRLRAVVDLLAGLSPAKVAAREGATEAELYAWRDAALAAARAGLALR